MITTSPGASFEARIDGFPTGLAGTVAVRILTITGSTAVARTTAGISEHPGSSGSYTVTLTAPPGVADYAIVWDQGTVSQPTVAAERLHVTSDGLTDNVYPSDVVHSIVDGFPAGLAGTVGVRVLDDAGATTTARTTSGIVELLASSGIYATALTAPSSAGQYSILWDDGSVSPSTTASEDLIVTAGLSVVTRLGTWSYDPTSLSTSTKDQVRMEIGDTNPDAPLLVDAEINQAVAVELNMWAAAARCCEIISRSFLRKADVQIGRGGTSLTYSTQAKQYADMAKQLRKKASGLHAPWAGGTSVADKEALADDDSLVQPIFSKKLMDSPWTGGQDLSTQADLDDA